MGRGNSELAENSYKNTINILDDEWWNSIFDLGHSNATGDQTLLERKTPAFGFTPLPYHIRGH